jgi:hypothetical protein
MKFIRGSRKISGFCKNVSCLIVLGVVSSTQLLVTSHTAYAQGSSGQNNSANCPPRSQNPNCGTRPVPIPALGLGLIGLGVGLMRKYQTTSAEELD